MQAVVSVEGEVSMVTTTPSAAKASKPPPAMSLKASAFTIASLMADCTDSTADDGGCSVTTSSTRADEDCVSMSGMTSGRRQRRRRSVESPRNCTSSCCTNVGMYIHDLFGFYLPYKKLHSTSKNIQ